MSDTSKRQRAPEVPKRGDAAWRAQRDEIASRNEKATRLARARRQEEYEQQSARQRAADLVERDALRKLRP